MVDSRRLFAGCTIVRFTDIWRVSITWLHLAHPGRHRRRRSGRLLLSHLLDARGHRLGAGGEPVEGVLRGQAAGRHARDRHGRAAPDGRGRQATGRRGDRARRDLPAVRGRAAQPQLPRADRRADGDDLRPAGDRQGPDRAAARGRRGGRVLRDRRGGVGRHRGPPAAVVHRRIGNGARGLLRRDRRLRRLPWDLPRRSIPGIDGLRAVVPLRLARHPRRRRPRHRRADLLPAPRRLRPVLDALAHGLPPLPAGPPGEPVENWPDDRIWAELNKRFKVNGSDWSVSRAG